MNYKNNIKKIIIEYILILLFSLSVNIVFAQSSQDHNHNYEHSHSLDSHTHSHLPVDYNFHSDSDQYTPPDTDDDGYIWWKGNLHTHTLWSDGDQFPEVVTEWYYENGYHFLALSDHNVLSRGKRWINPDEIPHRAGDAFELYQERFGNDWIETEKVGGQMKVQLKPLNEVRALFEESGRFLMIESEEITEHNHYSIHVNATNVLEFIEPQIGENVEETIRLNLDAVIEQREETGQAMIPHLNHPNFQHAVTAENMAYVENLRLFEVYNGHRSVYNFGADDGVKDLDRIWDIVLTIRLGELKLNPVYGLAVDDAHNYEKSNSDISKPGRGWVMVRSRFLTPEHIVNALEKGEFYSSSGVKMKRISTKENQYEVEVEPENGVNYTIQFIGTRQGYDKSSKPYVDVEGQERDDRTRRYSDDIGEVLQETVGTEATYRFEGDELYVRVKIISSKLKENFFIEGEREKAWLQPILPMLN